MGEHQFVSSQPHDTSRIHAAAVYCSDGRFGEHFDEFVQQTLGLPRYDRLAVPGGAACLAGHAESTREEEAVVAQLQFLIDVHGLERVVLIAHHGCAYYLTHLGVSQSELVAHQQDDLLAAAKRIESMASGLGVECYMASVQDGRVVFTPMPGTTLD